MVFAHRTRTERPCLWLLPRRVEDRSVALHDREADAVPYEPFFSVVASYEVPRVVRHIRWRQILIKAHLTLYRTQTTFWVRDLETNNCISGFGVWYLLNGKVTVRVYITSVHWLGS